MTAERRSSRACSADEVALGSGEMFDAIAPGYDRLNRILSLGRDGAWRLAAVRAMKLGRAGRALDVATGTADLAIAIARAHPDAHVAGLDASKGMLALARDKVRAAGLEPRIDLALGDAERLPFEDGAFDAASIAFGIRNLKDRSRALRELRRVVKPGGRVVVLELVDPRSFVLGPLARFYIHELLPLIGAVLSGGRAYRYLARSIAAFPAPDVFEALMRSAGIEVVDRREFALGSAVLFAGRSLGRGDP
jgi:demethylmenaquinone methyltransferase / 2-methoxy-6-polyprenyl-1,4-benzoquinol methylase